MSGKKMYKLRKKPLVHIFNASLSSGIFPDRLKLAKVIPLYKKGDVHDIKNYRPIYPFYPYSKNFGEINV
jgi:hypothetical protein